jgi:hypothetical protein
MEWISLSSGKTSGTPCWTAKEEIYMGYIEMWYMRDISRESESSSRRAFQEVLSSVSDTGATSS